MKSNTGNTERRAYKTLQRLAPQCRFTRFAGQLVRARNYMELASDLSIRTLMSRLYGELTRHRSYGILLRIGAVNNAKTRQSTEIRNPEKTEEETQAGS